MIAYKLFKIRKNNTLGSLFINASKVIPFDEWLIAEDHKTKGFAYRPGWHCCFKPIAPHLHEKPKNQLPRVWAEVEIEETTTYARPESQGGSWILANKMKVIKILNEEELKHVRNN